MRPAPYGFEFFESCVTCKARNDHFFCNLDNETLKEFDALTFSNVYPEGAVLCAEGQVPRGLFVICHGSAKLSVSSGDGKTLITRIAHAGEVVGLSSVLSGNPYKATAETLEPCQVNFVRRDDFLRFVDRHHTVCSRIFRQLTEECESDADHIRAIGLSHSAAEKLANLILGWVAESGKESGGSYRLQMLATHEDISQLIGTSRETVTRLLKEFRDRKLISIKGASLTVHDRKALQDLVLL